MILILNLYLVVKLPFITMLLTLYSSFAHYEKISKLTLSEDSGFILNFQKGKSYQFGESHIGVFSNLPKLAFNPARVFSIYLGRISFLHANFNHSFDLLFPSCKVSKVLEAPMINLFLIL